MEDKLKAKLTIKKPAFLDIRTVDFQYPREAYTTMEYGCEDCGKVEIIWNSRDGVTPFMVGCPDCHSTMQHINWSHDRFNPNYIPPIGSRVFFSCTNIHQIIQDIFDTYTEELLDRMEKYCTDRYELVWKMASTSIADKLRFEHPHMAVITEKNQERFMSRYAIISKNLKEMKKILRGSALSVAAAGTAFRELAAELKKYDIMERERIRLMEEQDATKETDNQK